MKKLYKLFPPLLFLFLSLIPTIHFGQAPDLRSTSNFTIFTAAGALNNLGPSMITGDVGTDVGALTGFFPSGLGVVIGAIHDENDPVSAQAAIDVDLVYSDLLAVTCGTPLGVNLGTESGQILTPGVYCLGGAGTLDGNLILDGQGDPNALFIIKVDGAFATGMLSNVFVEDGANFCNVYWQINGQFTLGEGSVFRGNVVASGAISLLEGSSIFGRALTRQGAISLHNIIAAFCNICILPPSVIITETNVNVCGTTTATFNYTVENGPTTTFTSNGTGTLSLVALPNGTSTFTYTPSAAEATTGAVVTITATIADPDGNGPCVESTDNATVTIVAPANAGTATSPATVCDNSAAAIDLFSLLTGEQAGGTWTRTTGVGGSFDANAGTFTPAPGSTSSTFTYTVTGTTPCPNDAEIVTVNIIPQANAGTATASVTVCNNSTISIDLFSLLTGEQAGGTWTVQSGIPGANFNAGAGTLNPNGLTAGTYVFRYTVTGTAPCANDFEDVTVNITAAPDLAAIIAQSNTCPITTFDLASLTITDNNNTIGTLSYYNNEPDATNETNGISATVGTSGTYYIRKETAEGCFDIVSVMVNITACPVCPTANLSITTNCAATGSATILIANGGNGAIINGNITNGVNDFPFSGTTLANGTATIIISNINVSGIYTIENITFTGITCTPITSGNAVITLAGTAGQDGSVEVCNDQTTFVNLSDLLTGESAGGVWSLQAGSPDPGINFNAANGTLDVNNLIGGTYQFIYTITNTAPCPNDEAVATVIVNETSQINAGNNGTICASKPVNLTTIGASISGGAMTGIWTTSGDGIFTGGAAFGTATAYVPGLNDKINGTVTLTLTSTGPCTATSDTVIITILQVECGAFPWSGN